MYLYQEEQIEDFRDEIAPILQKHWEELANNKDIRVLDVDMDAYVTLNRLGNIRVLTVRDDGKLIGYASFVIGNNLHYKTWKYAISDVYYLDPAYRKTGMGLSMFTEVERWLKGLGVKSVTVQDKIDHSNAGFFAKLDFKLIENVYEKVL